MYKCIEMTNMTNHAYLFVNEWAFFFGTSINVHYQSLEHLFSIVKLLWDGATFDLRADSGKGWGWTADIKRGASIGLELSEVLELDKELDLGLG